MFTTVNNNSVFLLAYSTTETANFYRNGIAVRKALRLRGVHFFAFHLKMCVSVP